MAAEFNSTPFLSIVVQPQNRFRFRYESEMRGTHGMLVGDGDDSVSKRFPSVRLHNFGRKEAIIRVSLATNEDEPFPHVHSLVAEKGQGKDVDYIDVSVNASTDYTGIFQGIAIIHRGKRFVHEVLTNRIAKMKLQKLNRNLPFPAHQELSSGDLHQIQELVKRKAPGIDPHAVKLKFEAFAFNEWGNLAQISPPIYSKPIFNEKGAQTGTLKIVKIDKAYSSCRGRDEIFIFVEKVSKKNIKVRFFELDPATKQENWHAFADFSETDVHHQYAIAFRTPPFRDLNIDEDAQVYMELYRPQDGARSEPRPFTYKPCESPRKRSRTCDVNGLNDQLANIFRCIVEESTFSHGSSAVNLRQNGALQSNQNEVYVPKQKWTLAPPSISPMTSLSVSPYSAAEESYCSSYCDSPSNTMVSPQHPHSDFSSVDSPYTSSEAQYETFTAGAFCLDDLKDNAELPDFFEFASGYTALPYNDVPLRYDGYEIKTERSNGMGGPPRLSSNGLASDSVCVGTASEQGERISETQNLAAMIGACSVNDHKPGHAKGLQVPQSNGHKETVRTSDHENPRAEMKQIANVGSLFHAILSICNDQKIKTMINLLVQEGGREVFDWKNNDGLTALHLAIIYGKMAAAEHLVQAGANVSIADTDGNTVLHLAAVDDESGPFLEVLLKGKGKEMALSKRNNQGFTPLHLAAEETSHKNVALLLKNGADPNLGDHRQGKTPLHVATEVSCLQCVQAILQGGKNVDVNIEAYDGKRALDTTTNDEIRTLLIAAGAEQRGDPEGYSSD